MRRAAAITLSLLASGCALPFGLEWARFPPPPRPAAQRIEPQYCIIALDPGSGITLGGRDGVKLTCEPQPRPRR